MDTAGQIEGIRVELRNAQAAVERLAASAGDAAWITRPKSGGWSASECVAHLTLTTDAYLPLLDEARARVPAGAPAPARYRTGVVAWLLAKTLEPPARGRTRTLPRFVPGGIAPREESVAEFTRSQNALLAWLDDAPRVPLSLVTIASPFAKRLRYNAYAAYRTLAAHQRRHLWQAERAVRGIP